MSEAPRGSHEHYVTRSLRVDLDRALRQVETMPDNAERSRAALEIADMLRIEYLKRVGAIRQEAVAALYHRDGYTLREIAAMLGVGVARAQQLASGITPKVRKQWRRK